MVFPSGDQRGEVSGSSETDIFVSGPPAASITQMSLLRPSSNSFPVRSETKAIFLPSGDHCGSVSFQSSPDVICFAEPVATSTTHRCDLLSSNQQVSLQL